MPLFIFDRNILDKLDAREDARVAFILAELKHLKAALEGLGSTILVKYGTPGEIFRQMTNEFDLATVYTNQDYEPYAKERDEGVKKLLDAHGIGFKTFKDQVIFEKDEVLKDNGDPYTIFTPYSRKWKELFNAKDLENYPSERLLARLFKSAPVEISIPQHLNSIRVNCTFPGRDIDENVLSDYHHTRDYPFLPGTSRLGIHLRFGTISVRKLAAEAARLNGVYLNELIWREFYMMILWHFPHVVSAAFKPAYDRIRWRNDEQEFQAWCEGRTGYPIVDAGMKELEQTGYMHNRLRMVTASFLSKHLLIDWRWGEAWFARKLLDFELSSNNGGWQWAAGTGCDAAPYFRVFNPDLQTQKFDPDFKYIRKWVPEFQSRSYPARIVDHAKARDTAIKAYKSALTNLV